MEGQSAGSKMKNARDDFLENIRRDERMEMLKRRPEPKKDDLTFIEEEICFSNKDTGIICEKLENQSNLASNPLSCKLDYKDLPTYKRDLVEGDLETKHAAIIKVRRCLCAQIGSPIQDVIDLEFLPYFVELVKQDEDSLLKTEAAWCLTNIANGDSHQVQKLVEKGVIPIFIQLLTSSNPDLVENAIWGLGNIAGDCPEFRNMVVMNYTMTTLVALYEKIKFTNEKLRDQIIWAASNLCRRKPAPDIAKILVGFDMFCEVLMANPKISTEIDCCWSLMAMCKDSTVQKFVQSGIIQKLVKLATSEEAMLQQPALKIISCLTGSGPEVCSVGKSN